MDKKKLIMGGVAVILIAGGVFLFTGKSSKGGIKLETAKVGRSTITNTVTATGAFSLGEQVTQSMPSGKGRVPLVSIQICFPASRKRDISALSIHRLGSPPVRITIRAGKEDTFSTISSSVIITPSSWRVSQKLHLRLQPEKRTNTAGVPVWNPSPCKL